MAPRTLLQHRSKLTLASLFILLLPSFGGAFGAEKATRGPDVVIIAGEEKVVYEYRQNGQLRMVKIVPKWGKPYYLVPADPKSGGDLERAEFLIPSWVIAEF